jgi:hypothetical protein
MGNGVGIAKTEPETPELDVELEAETPDPLPLVLAVTIIPNSFQSQRSLNPKEMAICRDTLNIIMSTGLHGFSTAPSPRTNSTASASSVKQSFFSVFWSTLQLGDPEDEIYHRFEAKPLSDMKLPDKNVIMIRLLRFLTKCPPAKFEARCRKLGVNHTRMGVTEQHMRMFAEALMKTIVYSLGPYADNNLVTCWVELIMFTIAEMTKVEQNTRMRLMLGTTELLTVDSSEALDTDRIVEISE